MEMIWKEAVMVHFKVPSMHLSTLTEENHEKPRSPSVAAELAR
jgi:hypothetical protein